MTDSFATSVGFLFNLTLNSLWQLQKNSGRVDLPFQLHYHRDIETDSPLLLRIIFQLTRPALSYFNDNYTHYCSYKGGCMLVIRKTGLQLHSYLSCSTRLNIAATGVFSYLRNSLYLQLGAIFTLIQIHHLADTSYSDSKSI